MILVLGQGQGQGQGLVGLEGEMDVVEEEGMVGMEERDWARVVGEWIWMR
jgi:hypothetical protein